MKPTLDKLKEAFGEVVQLTGPSGYKYTLRQQTGEDDDILSNSSNVIDGTSSNRFLQGLIIDTDHSEAINGKLSLDGVRALKLSDKYFLMIASRIFSIGQFLKFSYTWPDSKEPLPYEEDLGLYIWDYHNPDKPFPTIEDPDYFKYRIPELKNGKERSRTITLKSGKVIKYDYINGHGEKFLMNLPSDQQSINSELMARNLELQTSKDSWVRVENFKTFTSMDMIDIRRDVGENDNTLELVTEIENPRTKEKILYPLIGTPDFFYPREI